MVERGKVYFNDLYVLKELIKDFKLGDILGEYLVHVWNEFCSVDCHSLSTFIWSNNK